MCMYETDETLPAFRDEIQEAGYQGKIAGTSADICIKALYVNLITSLDAMLLQIILLSIRYKSEIPSFSIDN
jgi:hypothetical protein